MENCTFSHGAVIRGPKDEKKISLIFTGGGFNEGFGEVLDALYEKQIPGSFFFTGDFLRNPENKQNLLKAIEHGHYLGPHSDKHLLYCPWDDREKTLVSREEFSLDLEYNIQLLEDLGLSRDSIDWWIPPFEWYNEEIAQWSSDMGRCLFCFTPGTLSHADYTEDDAKNYRSNQVIYQSILDYEMKEPNGLNGFLLLTHVGAGEKRTEKFFKELGRLVDDLTDLGYIFISLQDMLRDA